MAFVMPQKPYYVNDAGQPIYFVPGANVGKRAIPGDVKLLVLHHTAGTDSRAYLWKNERGVSAHYLVGLYPDVSPGLAILKYASETTEYTHTQGFSRIGTSLNPNGFSISLEMEGPPIADVVRQAGATLAASIIRYWRQRGRDLLMVRHRDIDLQGKQDPELSWGAWCKEVYSQV